MCNSLVFLFPERAEGLFERLSDDILVPSVTGAAGDWSLELSLFGSIRPLLEYSVRGREVKREGRSERKEGVWVGGYD